GRALRTQQRVRRPPRTVCFPLPCGLYLRQVLERAPNNRCSTLDILVLDIREQTRLWIALRRPVLLRKEVIQPHLPVRLPCYDLVPIASPTFDGSLSKSWATGFGCYRLS